MHFMNMKNIHGLIERLSNLVRSEVRQGGKGPSLLPVHLEALHYLSICNRYSNTPQAVADYLGITKGTASQTIRVLERRGLLTRSPDSRDGRMVHLHLTPEGYTLVESHIPAQVFRRAGEFLTPFEINQLNSGLTALLRSVQKGNGMKSFGACHTCRYNSQRPEGYFCLMTREPLSPDDVRRICREHEIPTLG